MKKYGLLSACIAAVLAALLLCGCTAKDPRGGHTYEFGGDGAYEALEAMLPEGSLLAGLHGDGYVFQNIKGLFHHAQVGTVKDLSDCYNLYFEAFREGFPGDMLINCELEHEDDDGKVPNGLFFPHPEEMIHSFTVGETIVSYTRIYSRKESGQDVYEIRAAFYHGGALYELRFWSPSSAEEAEAFLGHFIGRAA